MRKSFHESGIQFAEKVEELLRKATKQGDCLISHLVPNAKGYIYVSIGRAFHLRANRLVYKVKNGELADDELVRHTCDNRACIEPTHLIKGSAQDNTDDMKERNRQARLGRPPTNVAALMQALNLHRSGHSLQQIADIQGLAGKTSAHDRVRRAKELWPN